MFTRRIRACVCCVYIRNTHISRCIVLYLAILCVIDAAAAAAVQRTRIRHDDDSRFLILSVSRACAALRIFPAFDLCTYIFCYAPIHTFTNVGSLSGETRQSFYCYIS